MPLTKCVCLQVLWGRAGVGAFPTAPTHLSAPNGVMDLHKEAQSTNSITLGWNAPTDPPLSGLHILGPGDRDPQGHQANQTGRTNETYYEVQALEPGTLYNFSVWAERNDVASSAQGLLEPTGEMGPLLPAGGLGQTWGQWEVSGLQIPSGHGVMTS